MNKLEPRRSSPILWALTEILGLTITDVQSATRIPRFRLYRLEAGTSNERAHAHSLVSLARKTMEQIASDSADDPTPGKDAFRSYRRAAYEAVNLAISLCDIPPLREEQPRETDLSRQLLQFLPPKGALRREVVSALRNLHRPRAIERCAQRLGVKELKTDHGRWWIPPKDLASIDAAPPPPAKFMKPRGKLQRRLLTHLLDYLKLHPRGSRPHDVIAYLSNITTSKSLVYRAARQGAVVRRTEGFGANKKTLWLHPPVQDEK